MISPIKDQAIDRTRARSSNIDSPSCSIGFNTSDDIVFYDSLTDRKYSPTEKTEGDTGSLGPIDLIGDAVIESTRVGPLDSPGVSPIKQDGNEDMDIS